MLYDPRMQTQYSNYMPTQDVPELEYSLIFSSVGCKYSNKIIDLIRESDITINLDVYDIQHFLQNGEDIPNYVDGTPQLIVSKKNQTPGGGGQVTQILLGFKQVSSWINNNIRKPNHSVSSNKKGSSNGSGDYVSIDRSHGNCKFAPPKITDFDEYGRPIADASIFSIPTEDRGSKGNIDMASIENERSQLDKQFGMAPGLSNGVPLEAKNPTPGSTQPARTDTVSVASTSGRRLEPASGGGYAPVGKSLQSAGGGGGKYVPVGK